MSTDRFNLPGGKGLLVFSEEWYSATSTNPNILLMPAPMGISPVVFRAKLRQHIREVTTLFVLRKHLCTSFVQDCGKIFGMGISAIVCYDNRRQMTHAEIASSHFDGVDITPKLRRYTHSPKNVLTFSLNGSESSSRLGAINPYTAVVREHLDKYESDYPSWLVALEISKVSTIGYDIHDLANAVRIIRGHKFMDRLPMLHELALWVLEVHNLNVFDKSDERSLLAACAEYVPCGSYLNEGNLAKVVEHIKHSLIQELDSDLSVRESTRIAA